MEEIDDTVELGVVAGLEFMASDDPRKKFIITAEYLQDAGGEHEGYTFSLSARVWYPVSKPIDVSIGVGATYADEDYMDTYFGVSPIDSARTGLPIFELGDGTIKDVKVIPAVVVHLSRSWHVAAGGRFSRLLDDAKDSPVVEDRGAKDQIIAGVGLAYSW
jgi:outer membrane protein